MNFKLNRHFAAPTFSLLTLERFPRPTILSILPGLRHLTLDRYPDLGGAEPSWTPSSRSPALGYVDAMHQSLPLTLIAPFGLYWAPR